MPRRKFLNWVTTMGRDVEAAAGGAEAGGRADLEHRLGARERELRALAAEKVRCSARELPAQDLSVTHEGLKDDGLVGLPPGV